MSITIRGNYKSGYYDSRILKNRFEITTNEAVKRSKSGTLVAIGLISTETPEGTPLMLVGDYDSNNIFITSSISVVADSVKTSRLFMQNVLKHLRKDRKDFKLNSRFANNFVDAFGPDIIAYLNKTSNADEIKEKFPKVHPGQIDLVYSEMLATVDSFSILAYFTKFGFHQWKAYELAKKYGNSALELIRIDPYRYGHSVGLTFGDCDLIAKDNNLDVFGNIRCNGIISEAFQRISEQDGSTVVLFSDLVRAVNYISKHSAYPNIEFNRMLIAAALEQSPLFKVIDEEGDKVPRAETAYYCKIDKDIVAELKRLSVYNKTDFEETMIDKTAKAVGINYSEGQRDMQKLLSTTGVKIVTGGPGAGKTTGVNGIIHTYKAMYPQNIIKLCAPTGRAAQRMNELTGMEATTIHKMINLLPFSGADPEFNEEANLKADLLIVDEFSMVDEELFLHLLKAIATGTLVIFVGDEDQLPSVGPGSVLRDLIASNTLECVRLNGSYRAGASSLIVNAHKILEQDIDFVIDDAFNTTVYKDDEELANHVVEQFLSEYDDLHPFNTQVLVTANKGACGTKELNKRIIEQLFPDETSEFFVNERILFTKNNTKSGYVNGDLGIIIDVLDNEIIVEIGKDTIIVKGKDLKDIVPSYAMTIHKSQGSEFPNVITVLPSYPKNMLNRNLFYTAVTRAKKTVNVLAVEKTIELAVSQKNNKPRKTRLKENLNGEK